MIFHIAIVALSDGVTCPNFGHQQGLLVSTYLNPNSSETLHPIKVMGFHPWNALPADTNLVLPIKIVSIPASIWTTVYFLNILKAKNIFKNCTELLRIAI